MIIYLSGPMTGYPEENYPAFHAHATSLRDLGYQVLNPAETGGGQHMPRASLIAIDMGYIREADALVVLPGWSRSQGALLEIMYADVLGKPVFTDVFPDYVIRVESVVTTGGGTVDYKYRI